MKNIKRIISTVILTIILQLAIFLLLNWKTDQLLNSFYRIDKESFVNTSLIGATGYSLSYNNKFLGCLLKNNLKIINLIDNSVITIEDTDSFLLGYKWFPDRNGLIYFTTDDQQRILNVYTLDLSSENDSYNPKLNRTISLDIKELLDVEISTYTNNLFMLYTNSRNKTELVKLDIMKNYNKINVKGETIERICVSNKFGNLFLESKNNGYKKIEMVTSGGRIFISDATDKVLLGCSDDLLYIGTIKEGHLEQINLYPIDYAMKQKLYKPSISWQCNIFLEEIESIVKVDKKLIIKSCNSIYIIEPDKKIRELQTANKIVLAPSGLMYLEIIEGSDNSRYYWRSIPE